jgi:primosomal replication protein N
LFYPTKLTKVADSDRSLPVEVEQSKRFMPEEDTDVKVVERSDQTTEPGTPAPDSDVQSLPLTGKPIKWNERSSSQLRFMPEYDRDAFPMMDDAILQSIMDETDTVAAIHIDRMGVGRYKGVDLQGGMFYPTILENLQKGIVWAFNSTATARKVLGMAAKNNGYVKLVLMQEGNVVGNKTFANIWFNELNESIQNKKISNAMALTQLNVARRLVYSKIKNKNVNKHPWVLDHSKQWTSIDQAKEALLNMPQQQRAGLYFQKTKTQTKSQGEKISYQGLLAKKMAKMGLPNALEIVNAIEEPAFNGIPTGATVAIIKIDPMAPNEKIMTAEEAGVPEHLSYKYVVKGKPIAKMKYYQIIDEVFPETKGEIITQGLTNFPVEKSIPSAATARGQIEF